MSLFGADFIRDAREELGDVDLCFTPHGYLILASEEGAETLRRNSYLQNELGAKNELLSAEKLTQKFPWLNTSGISLGMTNTFLFLLYKKIIFNKSTKEGN